MYDIIVIGGGIAGIYTTYQICKKNPKKKVLLLEKDGRLGGRIHTFSNEYMTVEAGAGRLSGSQPLIMELIRELGLTKKLQPLSGGAVFRPSDRSGNILSSSSDAPQAPHPLVNNLVDVALGPKTLPSTGLILRLVIASKRYSKLYLQNHSLVQFAEKVLQRDQVDYIKRTFGYYSELVIMNAYDAIKLFDALGPNNTFYGLKGGLEQIIGRMVTVLQKSSHITIMTRKEVSKIVYGEPGFSVYVNDVKYECLNCICAVPKNALKQWAIFKSIRPLLEKVACGTLCRIYSQFDPDPATGKVWFHGIDKFTTDNDVRMVIPIDAKSGTIMISYSDNIFADRWQKLYEQGGMRAVNRKLRDDIEASLGRPIPLPKHSQLFYWDCGVGYWGVGADSHKVAEKMVQPFPAMPLYICGENYSENGQQWVEGALETADNVLGRIHPNP
jgi:protoporphyrinogen oxidase